MTAETIHTCSYACERPECIRAQRDELASRLTTETSNAREWKDWMRDREQVVGLADHLEQVGWRQDERGDVQCFDQGAAMAAEVIRLVLLPMLDAPPPAAERGDVPGLVESLRFAASRWKRECAYHASGIADDYGSGQRHAFLSCANEMLAIIEQALAAEGVHCETCNGASIIVTYVDPYERGDVSSPEQSPCPDCAEGVQAGEVEQRARELLRHQYIKRGYSDGGATVRVDSIERYEPAAFLAIVAALSQQPEARGVVDEAVPRYVCLKAEGSRYAYVNDTQESRTVKRYDIFRRYGGMDGWTCATEHAASLNALTGERNG